MKNIDPQWNEAKHYRGLIVWRWFVVPTVALFTRDQIAVARTRADRDWRDLVAPWCFLALRATAIFAAGWLACREWTLTHGL